MIELVTVPQGTPDPNAGNHLLRRFPAAVLVPVVRAPVVRVNGRTATEPVDQQAALLGRASVRTVLVALLGLVSGRTGIVLLLLGLVSGRTGIVLLLLVAVSARTGAVQAGLAGVHMGVVVVLLVVVSERTGIARARLASLPVAPASGRTVLRAMVRARTVPIGPASPAGPLTAVRRVDPAGVQRVVPVAGRQVGRVAEHVVVSVVIPARRGSVVQTAAAAHVRMTAVIVPLASLHGVLPSR